MEVAAFSVALLSPFITVFDPSLAVPFNNWTDAHVAQGFSWRPGSVSFATLDDVGPVYVEVVVAPRLELASETQRGIVVPFTVPESGEVEVSGLDRGERVLLLPGHYALLFESCLCESGQERARLTFVESLAVEPAVLRADEALSPWLPLVMAADPAYVPDRNDS